MQNGERFSRGERVERVDLVTNRFCSHQGVRDVREVFLNHGKHRNGLRPTRNVADEIMLRA